MSRDPRFDGTFFVGVSTTGIYCRPICPARTPRKDRCTFFERAALAERQGYRACFRCRPELAPEGPRLSSVDAVSLLAARAARRIDEGALDDGSLDALAGELGVTSRHLRRAMDTKMGVSPLAYAQTRRLALAKQLLTDARLKLADVAFSSGYRSVRRFNAEFRERFGCTPSESTLGKREQRSQDHIDLRLDHLLPYDFDALLAFLRERAVPGVEHVDDLRYTRALALGGASGTVAVARSARPGSLQVMVSLSLARVLPLVVSRVRSLFDLDARPELIVKAFAQDAAARKMVRARPGLRVAGTLEPFEAAVRAVLAQQVSVRAARTLGGRLCDRFGRVLPLGPSSLVNRVFPDAAMLAKARAEDVREIGIPLARAQGMVALAQAVASGHVDLSGATPVEDVLARLLALRGMGPFTASVIAMRALHWPDAFPSSDLLVLRATGTRTAAQAEAKTRHLSPFRAYWVMHVWQRASEGAT
jgi:AraC family transcriptional regulator of adaptative response / DNA-3-methyladenine glycosylase II